MRTLLQETIGLRRQLQEAVLEMRTLVGSCGEENTL
jgi:hypothetical protein